MPDIAQHIPIERIERRIIFLRGQKVLLDSDLAQLYGVETKVLNQAVRRNQERFPVDFMFQLSRKEWVAFLRSQSVTTKSRQGGRRTPPSVFTEQGVAMLSSVLSSPQAIQVNIAIMRTFVQLRQMLSSDAEFARRLDALESKYDVQFKSVFEAIRELMRRTDPPVVAPKTREIGFHTQLPRRTARARPRSQI